VETTYPARVTAAILTYNEPGWKLDMCQRLGFEPLPARIIDDMKREADEINKRRRERRTTEALERRNRECRQHRESLRKIAARTVASEVRHRSQGSDV
jgi:hypothetical protein